MFRWRSRDVKGPGGPGTRPGPPAPNRIGRAVATGGAVDFRLRIGTYRCTSSDMADDTNLTERSQKGACTMTDAAEVIPNRGYHAHIYYFFVNKPATTE